MISIEIVVLVEFFLRSTAGRGGQDLSRARFNPLPT